MTREHEPDPEQLTGSREERLARAARTGELQRLAHELLVDVEVRA